MENITIKHRRTAFIVYGLYLVHVFAGNLITSVHAVYLLSKGITYFQLNSLTSIVLFLSILLEVLTGIIGDRFGHKVSFQLSMFLSAVRRACIPFVTVILGIAWTMIRSGTLLSAVISKKLSSYRKYYRLFKFALILLSTASLLGMAYTKSWFIGAFCFSVHAMVWVIFSTLNGGVLYSHIPDKAKATILSAISMIYSLAGIIGLSLLGLIADKNLTFIFTIAAISMCAILFTVLQTRAMKKRKSDCFLP